MKSNIIAASIIALSIILAAFVHSGRYYVLTVDKGIAIRVDRWTGDTKVLKAFKDDWDDLSGASSN